MTTTAPVPTRKLVYSLLITVAAGAVAGRILATELVVEPSLHDLERGGPKGRVWPTVRPKPMPTFSSNDRSRWATIEMLVTEGTYVIGRRERLPDGGYVDRGLVFEDGWKTVDKVLNPDTQEFYSSKPPLLATLVAGLYWLLYQLGWSLTESPWTV